MAGINGNGNGTVSKMDVRLFFALIAVALATMVFFSRSFASSDRVSGIEKRVDIFERDFRSRLNRMEGKIDKLLVRDKGSK